MSKGFLKVYSFVYLIIGLLGVTMVVSIYAFPDATKDIINEISKSYEIKNLNPKTAISLSISISTVLYLIYSWLVRRVANGKSRGTLLLILLFLSVVGGVANQFVSFSIYNCILITIDAFAFYAVCKVRK